MSKRSFIRYVRKVDTDPQTVFFEDSVVTGIVPELKERGTRRILVICALNTRKFRYFEDMVDSFIEQGFRVFAYKRNDEVLSDKDIEGALKIYKEYNCDSIVSVGGTAEIDCAKLVAALAANRDKNLYSITGTDKLSSDIRVLCCIVTDNSPSGATASAEYYSNETSKWETVLSPYLVPHIVAFDPEFSSRIPIDIAVSTAMTSLCMAIEAYLSPIAQFFPEYRANAMIAIMKIFGTLDKLYKKPSDTYLRKQVAAGGFYSGLSTRKAGYGYAHIIMHCLQSRYSVPHGTGMCRILTLILKATLERNRDDLAMLSRDSHFCTMSIDAASAAQSFIESITRLYQRVECADVIPPIKESEIDGIVADVEKEALVFGLRKTLDSDTLRSIINILSCQP